MLGQSRSPLLFQCWSIVYDAGSTLLQHRPNTWFFYTSVYSNHWTANQCYFNVDPTCLTMAQQQPSIMYVYIGYFAAIAIGVTISSPVARKATTQIHWPNCEIMLDHRLRRWENITQPKKQMISQQFPTHSTPIFPK